MSFARKCGYVDEAAYADLERSDHLLAGGLIKMIAEAETWCGPATLREDNAPYDTHGNGHQDYDFEDPSPN